MLYPYPYPRPNKKLIGFGSFEKVNSKLAGGPDPWPPGQLHLVRGVEIEEEWTIKDI